MTSRVAFNPFGPARGIPAGDPSCHAQPGVVSLRWTACMVRSQPPRTYSKMQDLFKDDLAATLVASKKRFDSHLDDWMNDGIRENESEVLFCEDSKHGNGLVRVRGVGPWRYMTFDDSDNKQGVAYFEDRERPCPEYLSSLYQRVMVTAALGFIGLQQHALTQQQHVLCIGLGAGSVSGFLSHHLPSLKVDVVEIDPVVVKACFEQLGCQFRIANQPSSAESSEQGGAPYTVFIGDGADYVRGLARERRSSADADGFSAILLDAFDCTECMPAQLLEPEFLRDCRELLRPGGVLVYNCVNGYTQSGDRDEFEATVRLFADCVGPVYTIPVGKKPEYSTQLVLVSRRGAELPRPGWIDLKAAALKFAGWNLGIDMDWILPDMLWTEILPAANESSDVREAINIAERYFPGSGLSNSVVELRPPARVLQDVEGAKGQWQLLANMLRLGNSAPLRAARGLELGFEAGLMAGSVLWLALIYLALHPT